MNKILKFSIFFLLQAVVVSSILGQEQDSTIIVSGLAVDENGIYKSDLLIVNERTYTGTFGNTDGTFRITAKKTDELVFGSMGYRSVKVNFTDSVYREEYKLNIRLYPLEIKLGAAEVIAPRDLEDIQRDIEKLGFEAKDYRVSGANALESPITFLYEMFSRRERSKRLVMEMENDDRRRELLKELFGKYVDYEIIDLTAGQFEDFIEYLNVSDEFLKSSSQYDFIVFVKRRFIDYKRDQRIKPLDTWEYNYRDQDPIQRDTTNQEN